MLFPALSVPSLNSRFMQLVLLTICLLAVVGGLLSRESVISRLPSSYQLFAPGHTASTGKPHPIDHLIRKAQVDFKVLVKKQTSNVTDGAQEYRKRRGRQPPPGYEAWYQYAKSKDAVIVESFFDPIYDDLEPFWGVPAKQIREQANVYEHRISVRDGNVSVRTDNIADRPWMGLWQDMVQSIATFLPDLDMAINHMDESRIVVPWEEIDQYMQKAQSARKIVPSTLLKQYFDMDLVSLDEKPPPDFDPEWVWDGLYWPLAVVGCSPESEARNAPVETDFTGPPPLPTTWAKESFEGYVLNWTFTKSPCDNPEIQSLHGAFIEPTSIAHSRKFFPLFGGCKLSVNNEILLPPAMYWTEDPFYSGGNDHGRAWSTKKDKMIWRGAASGGRNKAENWTRFQRHRFLSMVNATSVGLALSEPDNPPPNFVLPANDTTDSYDLLVRNASSKSEDFANWIASWSNATFVHLLCFPDPDPPRCDYTGDYFSLGKSVPMKDQYSYKYLPDIDGNSFSGRYRGFLLSTSLPMKATLFKEWHDSRLIPWKHFVPMDNTFIDFYGLMEYFVGNKGLGLGGHDQEAEYIATAGKSWAESVLRKEDMSIYVYRLLLEYARLCDDDREIMGWAEPDVT